MPHPLLLSVALFLGLWFLSTSRSSIRRHSILHIRATSNWLQTCGTPLSLLIQLFFCHRTTHEAAACWFEPLAVLKYKVEHS